LTQHHAPTESIKLLSRPLHFVYFIDFREQGTGV
jgi:hypothetical protein